MMNNEYNIIYIFIIILYVIILLYILWVIIYIIYIYIIDIWMKYNEIWNNPFLPAIISLLSYPLDCFWIVDKLW